MGMENLLNYYFIMKKRFVTVLLACSLAGGLFAQQPWFKRENMILPGWIKRWLWLPNMI